MLRAMPLPQRLLAAAAALAATLPAQPASGRVPLAQLREVLEQMRAGKFAEVLPRADELVERHPEDPHILHLRAVCRGKTGRHQEAIADTDRALRIDPRHAAALAERGYNLFRLGQHERALADYDRSLELQPKNPMAHGERGDLLLELGRRREAIAAYDTAIEQYPEWFEAHTQRALCARELADFELARQGWTRVCELQPENPYALLSLAGAQFDCGLDDEALATSRRLCELDASGNALMLHGRLCWQLDRHEQAREALAQATESDLPEVVANARLTLGSMELALGNHRAALEALQPTAGDAAHVVQLRPWTALMRWCARASLGEREAADAALRDAMADDPAVDDLLRELTTICLGTGTVDTTSLGPRALDDTPRWFFAGYRALVDGDPARADALLLRSVNSGNKDSMQWRTARTLLLQRLGGAEFRVGTGGRLEVVERDGTALVEVRAVDTEPPGAAALQGLQKGDRIVRVSDAPYDAETWLASLPAHRVGHDLHLTLRRGDETVVLLFELGWTRD